MFTYARVAELPLEVESVALTALELAVAAGWTRRTAVVRLSGRGEEGVGEDVTYLQDVLQARLETGPPGGLAGRHTLDSFSRTLERPDPFERWAYESAALDLALRQAALSLAEVLGREAQPVTFVVSTGLGNPPSAARLRRLLETHPGTRLKLDPTSSWNDDLIAELAALGAVDTLDFKGILRGGFGEPPDPGLYRRIAEAFPEAWLEDPNLEDDDARRALDPFRDRITWDAPIHSVADIEALPFEPRTLNFKPSRFGSVRALLDAYDHCAERGISVYGGGQFELGPGRGQIQQLASLFHPDAPNDVAPVGYNEPEPGRELPRSPLPPAPATPGFR